MRRFGFGNFLTRWVFAVALVLATFNPSGWSLFHLFFPIGNVPDFFEAVNVSFKVGLAIFMTVIYIIYLRATWRSIGVIGLTLALGFVASLIWMLTDAGILDLRSLNASTYVIETMLATVMAIGLSWSHIRRRIAGQSDIDDLGDEI